MSFEDVLKKSFLDNYEMAELGRVEVIEILLISMCIGLYIFVCYKYLVKNDFYSNNFNISLVVMCVITAAIILAIQSSVVISLGMVGALSIVRFRTAIKEPMDLLFMFWAISIGIICGAGLIYLAIVMSLVNTLIIVLMNIIPYSKDRYILSVIAKMDEFDERGLDNILKNECKWYKERSRSIHDAKETIIFEVRPKSLSELAKVVSELDGIDNTSIVSQNSEVVF